MMPSPLGGQCPPPDAENVLGVSTCSQHIARIRGRSALSRSLPPYWRIDHSRTCHNKEDTALATYLAPREGILKRKRHTRSDTQRGGRAQELWTTCYADLRRARRTVGETMHEISAPVAAFRLETHMSF
jgi:hypothetical protein